MSPFYLFIKHKFNINLKCCIYKYKNGDIISHRKIGHMYITLLGQLDPVFCFTSIEFDFTS